METKNVEKSDEDDLVVKYKNEDYDISDFIVKHPGGVNYLNKKNNKSIDEDFEKFKHSKAAEYLMKEYKVNKSETHDLDESMEVMQINNFIVSFYLLIYFNS